MPFQVDFFVRPLLLLLLLIVVSNSNGRTLQDAENDSKDEPYVPHAPGWTPEGTQCLSDMEEADSNYDYVLNHHEFFIFCDTMANRMFDMMDALDEQLEWELDELYEDLILQNPSNITNGVDVMGSSYDTLWSVEVEQDLYLKKVCSETAAMLRKIGPKNQNE